MSCVMSHDSTFALGFVFRVHILNCEFKSQIAMRPMMRWCDMEKNSFMFTCDSCRNVQNHNSPENAADIQIQM